MWKTCPRFPSFISKHTPWLVHIHNSYILSSISSVLYAFSNLYKIGYCLFGIYCLAGIFMFFDYKHACISPLTIFKCEAKLFENQKTNDSGIVACQVTSQSGNLTFIVTIHYIPFLCGLSQTRWDVKKEMCKYLCPLEVYDTLRLQLLLASYLLRFWMVKYTIICQKRSVF